MVQMQRRHYEFIASTILSLGMAAQDRVLVAQGFADALADTNPQFRRSDFMAAATGGDYRFKS